MSNFLNRDKAREYLAEKGIVLGELGLANHASRDTGPKYSIINGRALYTERDLDAWVAKQASREPPKRKARSGPEKAA